jgi:hypothetical protein
MYETNGWSYEQLELEVYFNGKAVYNLLHPCF